MKVLFYTATCYLDTSLEIINVLKTITDLHVIIEITEDSKNHTVSEVSTLPSKGTLVKVDDVVDDKVLNKMTPYFEGVRSIHYAVHPKKGLSASIKANYNVCKFVQKLKPDVLHLEAMLSRSIGLVPALFWCKQLAISIHDPLPHSGEKDWKIDLVRKVFFNFPKHKTYFFYSRYAKNQFTEFYKNIKNEKKVLKMGAINYFRNYSKHNFKQKDYILFFGRISIYKGIDILLEAIPTVFERFPTQSLVIAGRSINGYKPDQEILEKYKNNIIVIDQHIGNADLVKLIEGAKFVICPYKDATQSGVLMTAYALGTPVIATNVGAFPEFIDHNKTGILVNVNDQKSLSEAIITALDGAYYSQMADIIRERYESNSWEESRSIFLNAYSN